MAYHKHRLARPTRNELAGELERPKLGVKLQVVAEEEVGWKLEDDGVGFPRSRLLEPMDLLVWTL